jgi:peroxiredoxin
MKTLHVFFLVAFAALFTLQTQAGELKPYKGKPLPDFELSDLKGGKHKLSDYKGKVVLVNFWATWCPPCVKEMPSMQRLQDKYQDRDFQILAVNMGEDATTITIFLDKIKVNFPILMDSDGAVLKQWKIFAFPTTFLVDKEGNIAYGLFGGLEWDSPEAMAVVDELLKK